MPGFRFDDTCSFEENFEAFLMEIEGFDAEMAEILRANQDKLAAMMGGVQGDRRARGEFNQAVAEALDALLAEEGSG